MKELVKPQPEACEVGASYEALDECTTVNIGCICETKYAYGDEDQEDIIF